jgi:hypothetical protein
MTWDPRLSMLDYLRYWNAHERSFTPDEQTIEELGVIASFLMTPEMRTHHDMSDCCGNKDLFLAITRTCIGELERQSVKLDEDLMILRKLKEMGNRDETLAYLRGKIDHAETEFEKCVLSDCLMTLTG